MSGKPMANASEPPHSGFFQVFQLKTVFCTLVTSFAKPSSASVPLKIRRRHLWAISKTPSFLATSTP